MPPPAERAVALRGPAAVASAAQVFVEDIEVIEVVDEDAHHLARVLRLRAGEPVVACDGRGNWRLCRYTGAAGGSAGARLLEPEGDALFEPAPSPVTVAFAPVKGDRPEWVVQKCTELGVDRVVVMQAARSVVRWEGERATRALERLRRVAREAAAQSRRAHLPELAGPLGLDQLSALVAPDLVALAHPGGSPMPATLRAVAIGPEGGWDDSERSALASAPVGIGPGVLRAETAALAVATLLCARRDRTLPTG